MTVDKWIIDKKDIILVTGASGFVGQRVIAGLLERGFVHLRCLVRSIDRALMQLPQLADQTLQSRIELIEGNLLSRADSERISEGVAVAYHLAAGTGTKAFSEAFLHSVVTTRNLLEALNEKARLQRFVNVSSFAVYSNRNKSTGRLLDETAPLEAHPETRAEAYCYGKVKQDEFVVEFCKKHDISYTILRPGVVYGPGKTAITGRVGVDSFGIFLHLGLDQRIPFTFVDNCADAIILAGLKPGIDGEAFNVVDDDLPTSRFFLKEYKRRVRRFRSIDVPRPLSFLFCWLWEGYASWSKGQLPPVFTRREWHAFWKKTEYSNRKLKDRTGWTPRVSTEDGLALFFKGCNERMTNA